MLRALRLSTLGVLLSVLAVPAGAADAVGVWDEVEHHFAQNQGVKIHYVTLGKGPTVLFLHGFPDFWYSWRDQMAALSGDFRTAAIDLRGYNQSDQPQGIENYRLPLILDDVAAVVRDLGGKVTLVGHDWGGAIAWRFAMTHPESVERLVILNLTHPRGYAAVVANPTDAQRANTEYARRFATSQPDGAPVPDRILAMGDRFGPVIGGRYREAFGRSSYDGMLNYYRANYGQASGAGVETAESPHAGAAVPRLEGHRRRQGRAQEHLGLDRGRLHTGDHSFLRPLGAVGGLRAGVVDHEGVAAGAGALSAVVRSPVSVMRWSDPTALASAGLLPMTAHPSDGDRVFRFRVSPESRCFDGHFAGLPILPGVGHLAMVASACARRSAAGPGARRRARPPLPASARSRRRGRGRARRRRRAVLVAIRGPLPRRGHEPRPPALRAAHR